MPRLKIDARKQPRQGRSAATVESILQAAARVLSRHSLDGFNTNRVAEVAGVSIGSLYQYFPNKAALVAALIDRDHAALAAALEALLASNAASGTLRETLTAIAALLIEQQYGDPLYAAALDHEERRLPLGERGRRADERFVAIAETILARHREEISHPLPPAAASDLLTIARALVDQGSDGRSPAPPDLQARIVRALLGYLQVHARR